eukprot:gene8906-12010_t
MANSMVKITSYNVLSSHLSSPTHFLNCKPEFLDPKYRLNKVKEKLEKEISSNSVICLQEISHSWGSALHPLFAANNYHFVTGFYGSKFNGYMGIGVAIPLSKYEIVDVDITRVADTKRMPRKDKPSLIGSYINWMKNLLNSIGLFLRLVKPKDDMWDNVLYRYNQMINVRLKSKSDGKTFVVGTYHMPCMFKLPSVMVTHCALSAQLIQKFAKDDPYVYTGDFNIKPDSTMYRLLTEGDLETSNPDYPVNVPGDEWKPNVKPFKSAYKTYSGKEPDFTNYAQVQNDPVFIETLDYIFHSDEWNVTGVQTLPDRSDVAGPLPNQNEPSDHMLISAEMKL